MFMKYSENIFILYCEKIKILLYMNYFKLVNLCFSLYNKYCKVLDRFYVEELLFSISKFYVYI